MAGYETPGGVFVVVDSGSVCGIIKLPGQHPSLSWSRALAGYENLIGVFFGRVRRRDQTGDLSREQPTHWNTGLFSPLRPVPLGHWPFGGAVESERAGPNTYTAGGGRRKAVVAGGGRKVVTGRSRKEAKAEISRSRLNMEEAHFSAA